MACIDVAPETPEAAEAVVAALSELHEAPPVLAFSTEFSVKVLRFEHVSNQEAFTRLLGQLNVPYAVTH